MQLTFELMYAACLNKDTSFEGVFVTAVKTTGIFCRPSCTARKPKKENVEFLATADEATTRGFRACKICRPLEKLNETPAHFKAIVTELLSNPQQKWSDKDLLAKGIEPSQIRRWFVKHHGMTFQAFGRQLRINDAHKKLQDGASVTHAAFESGYESLSGFGDAFKNQFGVSPRRAIENNSLILSE
ncbi:MAG: helix-turn-helix domain-containing protein [Cytophagales bacterium]|nr:MAG: helix-turn-helix domain-containing protein [Cytophagales bacterium]